MLSSEGGGRTTIFAAIAVAILIAGVTGAAVGVFVRRRKLGKKEKEIELEALSAASLSGIILKEKIGEGLGVHIF